MGVIVRGQNFRFNSKVFFGGIEALRLSSTSLFAPVVADTASLIAVSVPPYTGDIPPEGVKVDLEVRNPDGQRSVLTEGFLYTPQARSFPRPELNVKFMRLVFCNGPDGPPCTGDMSFPSFLGKFKSVAVENIIGSNRYIFPGGGRRDMYAGRSRSSGPDQVYLNNGTLRFSDWAFFDSSGAPHQHTLAFGLFDKQGDVRLLGPETNQAEYGVVLANLDGDGLFDAVLPMGNEIKILIGDGRGSFTDESASRIYTAENQAGGLRILPNPIASVCPGSQESFCWSDVKVGDVDGMNGLDIAVASRSGTGHLLLLNDGTGHFTARFLTSSDKLEEVLGGPPTLYSNLERGYGSHDVELADINNDGDLDLIYSGDALATDSGPPIVYEPAILINCLKASGEEASLCGPHAGTLYFVKAGDRISTCCYSHVGAHAIELPYPPLPLFTPQRVPLDFNNDGYVDLHFGSNPYGLAGNNDIVWINLGAEKPGYFVPIGGPFTGLPFPSVPSGLTYSAAYGDLDGDGRVDIVQTEYFEGQAMIYLNRIPTGTPALDVQAMAAAGTAFKCLPLTMPDCKRSSNTYWQAQTPFMEPYPEVQDSDRNGFLAPIAKQLLGVALGDLDGDGALDIVFAAGDSPLSESLRIYLNNSAVPP